MVDGFEEVTMLLAVRSRQSRAATRIGRPPRFLEERRGRHPELLRSFGTTANAERRSDGRGSIFVPRVLSRRLGGLPGRRLSWSLVYRLSPFRGSLGCLLGELPTSSRLASSIPLLGPSPVPSFSRHQSRHPHDPQRRVLERAPVVVVHAVLAAQRSRRPIEVPDRNTARTPVRAPITGLPETISTRPFPKKETTRLALETWNDVSRDDGVLLEHHLREVDLCENLGPLGLDKDAVERSGRRTFLLVGGFLRRLCYPLGHTLSTRRRSDRDTFPLPLPGTARSRLLVFRGGGLRRLVVGPVLILATAPLVEVLVIRQLCRR